MHLFRVFFIHWSLENTIAFFSLHWLSLILPSISVTAQNDNLLYGESTYSCLKILQSDELQFRIVVNTHKLNFDTCIWARAKPFVIRTQNSESNCCCLGNLVIEKFFLDTEYLLDHKHWELEMFFHPSTNLLDRDPSCP